MAIKLNLGCGSNVVDGWINVDYALGAKLAKYPLFSKLNKKLKIFKIDWSDKIFIYNLSKRFPWKDNAIDVIYCSHTLEHFTREDGHKFLIECHRILRPGGIIRIIVPDLGILVKYYREGKIRADEFVKKLGVLPQNSNNLVKKGLLYLISFPHKCMYDKQSLLNALKDVGFNAKSKGSFESNIDKIELIELDERTTDSVIIEAEKKREK
jgi:ubiquinone/menaquinone biosynthesis C-methylase UbiE